MTNPVNPPTRKLQDGETITHLTSKLKEYEERIGALESGARSSQLQQSTIDTDKGQGYIRVMRDNVERGRIGRMPDGTITTVSVNNVTPPSIPLAPVVTPIIGGLSIGVESLEAAEPYDFSHLRVYVDGLLDGVISKLPGIWISAPLDPNTTHTVRITAINQSGTESAKSPEVIAQPLKVVDEIELGEITETMIADDSISTPKLKALAVVAEKIAANAIEAGHIQAGSVSAEKLAAQIILANQSIIAGSVGGARVEMSGSGIEQYSAEGQLLISMSSGGGAGTNIWTVADPADPQFILATLAANGNMTLQSLTVSKEATFYGYTLNELINFLPRGIQSFGDTAGTTASTTAELGIYELAFTTQENRLYRVSTSSIYVVHGDGAIRVKYTTDGSRPTLSSPLLTSSAASDYITYATSIDGGYGTTVDGGFTGGTSVGTNAPTGPGGVDGHIHFYGENHTHSFGFGSHNHLAPSHTHTYISAIIPALISTTFSIDGGVQMRLLFTLYSYEGKSVQASAPAGASGMQFIVEDIGPKIGNTGGTTDGSGTGGGGTTRVVDTFDCIDTRNWRVSNFNNAVAAGRVYQGQDPNETFNEFVTEMYFDHSAINLSLTGAVVIEKVELFIYCALSANSTGMDLVLGAHNHGSPANAFLQVQSNLVVASLGRPEGRWITLPNSIATDFANGTIKGLTASALAQPDAEDPKYYGVCYGSIDTGVIPQLRFTYTK